MIERSDIKLLPLAAVGLVVGVLDVYIAPTLKDVVRSLGSFTTEKLISDLGIDELIADYASYYDERGDLKV